MIMLNPMKFPQRISESRFSSRGILGSAAFVLSSIFLLLSFVQKISNRGGFDWDELYLIRAASFGNLSDFLTQIWPEPTPPMQAILFKILVLLGVEPLENTFRSLNLVVWISVFITTWYIAVKSNRQILLILVLTLSSINFYPFSYVAQARPYFVGFFLMVLFVIVWLRDFSTQYHPSRFLLFLSVLLSLVHVYGAIVCVFMYLLWSMYEKKFFLAGFLASVIPYSLWFLISISNAKDKVGRVAWMVVPSWSDLVVHIKGQLFGGTISFYIVLIGVFLSLITIAKAFMTRRSLQRNVAAQLILLLSFIATLLFAYFGSNIVPIWYPRNFLFALPCVLFASALAYHQLISIVKLWSKFVLVIVLGLSGSYIVPLGLQALYSPSNVMSQGNYRDTTKYALDYGFINAGDTVIGWEDTQVYEFYLSRMGMGKDLNLDFESRFASDSILSKKSSLVVLAADGQVDTVFSEKLTSLNLNCVSTEILNGNIVRCEKI
jgi:hypothetical protein